MVFMDVLPRDMVRSAPVVVDARRPGKPPHSTEGAGAPAVPEDAEPVQASRPRLPPNAAAAVRYTAPMDWLDDIKWDRDGLVPVIAQERGSGDVLMFAWMNREALARTAAEARAVYWSRSRRRLWAKGEESGNVQQVHAIRLDCDNDVLLLEVTQLGHEPGIACHTGRHRCFFQRLEDGAWKADEPVLEDPDTLYRPR
jgi:phosphoribosyl-AMP cyclohydrolase